MAETKKRIIQYNEELAPALDDYLLLDSPTAGTRKILALNIGGGGGNANVVELTYAQYMALTPAERADGTIYMVTDDPNDSGVNVPINYSTTEQDTGLKWIDGKPIYQKTFVISNNNYVDISGLNIDTFVRINGLCSVDNGNAIIPLYDNVTSEYRCYLDMDRGNMRMRFNIYGWTLDSGHITLQYTKTTD